MATNTDWKSVLQEPNAVGWIAFLILVVGIGAGTILFDSEDTGLKEQSHAAAPAPK